MRNGKYAKRGRLSLNKKSLALVLALVLMVGGVMGGTLAWLLDTTEAVTNTFTESDIDITLSETKPDDKTAKMIPGWSIEKDPKVKVEANSEDCWLFVKVTESTNPDLDTYISYAIADGWEIYKQENSSITKVESISELDEVILARKVYKDDTTKEFGILKDNKVTVKDTVTKDLMNNITGNEKQKPTLSFQAYAVQLFKTNSDGDKNNTNDEFSVTEAWAKAVSLNSGN